MDDIPERVIQNLRRFNRKERYYLIGAALGNPEFKMGKSFRDRLQKCLDLTVPKNAFAAMDYHLDWIYASLCISATVEQPSYYPLHDAEEIEGNQRDVDFLIAYESGGICHIVMVEAKGVLSFSNSDLKRKAERLKVIWGDDGRRWCNVEPHFVIASPSKPSKLNYEGWPRWMLCQKDQWLRLPITEDLQKVKRINRDPTNKKRYASWKVM